MIYNEKSVYSSIVDVLIGGYNFMKFEEEDDDVVEDEEEFDYDEDIEDEEE